ncbi:MAG: hypothetical protein AAF617_03710 [Bacteroidota bacterium]
MNLSQQQLLYLHVFPVLMLVLFESILDNFLLEEIFSLWYSVPICVLTCVLQYSLLKERLQLVSMLIYVGILFLTILSLLHLLLFDSGFGLVETTISITHISAVFLNVLMMSFAILQFRQHTRQQKSYQ